MTPMPGSGIGVTHHEAAWVHHGRSGHRPQGRTRADPTPVPLGWRQEARLEDGAGAALENLRQGVWILLFAAAALTVWWWVQLDRLEDGPRITFALVGGLLSGAATAVLLGVVLWLGYEYRLRRATPEDGVVESGFGEEAFVLKSSDDIRPDRVQRRQVDRLPRGLRVGQVQERIDIALPDRAVPSGCGPITHPPEGASRPPPLAAAPHVGLAGAPIRSP